jgi:hypothetical protein
MDPLATTDLFKFLAVRPAQLVSQKETQLSLIRDERGTTADGKVQLARLARELSVAGSALARWQALDLSEITPLAEGYRDLVRYVESAAVGDDPLDGRGLLNDAGLSDLGVGTNFPQVVQFAWDALYTAYATGPQAGQHLETPTAALRVLHFALLLGTRAQPTTPDARQILAAAPAIPTAFYDRFHPVPTVTRARGGAGGDSDARPDAERTERLRTFATEISATRGLLESAISAPALATPIAQPAPPEPAEQNGFSRSRFTLSTVPPLRAALPDDLSDAAAALLARLRVAETTPIPAAVETLQAHMVKLTDQAVRLADDAEFQAILRELEAPTTLALKTAAGDPVTTPDVNVSGRIIPGIGDLKVVKQTLLAYIPGEVAHIENVLKGEFKERNHRKLDRTETSLLVSEEETRETGRDTQSTDRFELKRETEQTVKEDMSVKAGLTVTGTFGPVVTTASGDFAYSTSKQDSQKNSSDFAREVVDRSVSKVQTKARTERTTKTLSEVEEINTHGVDNAGGAEHVIGIYRWVDKRYRAQVYNYGPRLMLEFVIPEPAAFHRAAGGRRPVKVHANPPPPFVRRPDPGAVSLGTGPPPPLTAAAISETNYQMYAAIYSAAGVTGPPPLYKYVSAALAKEGIEPGKGTGVTSKDLVVPEGYSLQSFNAIASFIYVTYGKFALQVGPYAWGPFRDMVGGPDLDQAARAVPDGLQPAAITPISAGPVSVSVAAYDVMSFAVNVQGICKRDDATFRAWQVQAFDKLSTAYQVLRTAYDQAVTQAEAAAGFAFEGQNPASNRTTEKIELKKLCITMMTGQHYSQFDAVTDPPGLPELDIDETFSEGPVIQFLEQAFDWAQMTYLFYPYFWGRKQNWVEVANLHDPDPLFQQFLTAGAARVLVPVPLAYQDAVLYMLQSKSPHLSQKVWAGGGPPTIDSPHYRSIADEMRRQTDDLAGAKPDGDPWEFTLPTTLVWLQPDSALPTFT